MKKSYLLFFIFVLSLYPKVSDASDYIDSKIVLYMANVAGGMEVVNDYAKEKTNAPINSIGSLWNTFEQITLENFEKVSGGFDYLINDILNVPGRGLNKINKAVTDYSKSFASNINGNLDIVEEGVYSMSASVSAGVKNNLDLILLTDEDNRFRTIETNNIPVLIESVKNVGEYTVFWMKTD